MKSTFNGKEYWGHPKFYEFLEKMAEVHSRKNHDYSGDGDPLKNLRAPTRLGVTPFIGVMVRLQDKASRLEQFVNSGKLMVKDESVLDTLIDQANYSILAAILYQEKQDQTPVDGDVVPILCEDCANSVRNGGSCSGEGAGDPGCFEEVV